LGVEIPLLSHRFAGKVDDDLAFSEGFRPVSAPLQVSGFASSQSENFVTLRAQASRDLLA
jgi:hypothetical protein